MEIRFSFPPPPPPPGARAAAARASTGAAPPSSLRASPRATEDLPRRTWPPLHRQRQTPAEGDVVAPEHAARAGQRVGSAGWPPPCAAAAQSPRPRPPSLRSLPPPSPGSGASRRPRTASGSWSSRSRPTCPGSVRAPPAARLARPPRPLPLLLLPPSLTEYTSQSDLCSLTSAAPQTASVAPPSPAVPPPSWQPSMTSSTRSFVGASSARSRISGSPPSSPPTGAAARS
eukprot:COSAG04_NODE_225_length_19578_cov_17.172647_9_plen_230_part_00